MNSILNEMVSTTKTSQISGCGRLQKAKVNCSHIFRIHMPVPDSRDSPPPTLNMVTQQLRRCETVERQCVHFGGPVKSPVILLLCQLWLPRIS